MKEEFKRSIETPRPHYSIAEEEDSKDRELRASPGGGIVSSFVSRRKRQREFEAIGADVEKWAHELLFEQNGEEHGWKEVKCNKGITKKFNRNGSTTCYIKVRLLNLPFENKFSIYMGLLIAPVLFHVRCCLANPT